MTTEPPKKELKCGRYVLLRALGEGSQGETYEAIDKGVGIEGTHKDSRSLIEEWDRYVTGAKRQHQSKGGEKAPPIPRDSQLVAIKCFRVGKAKAWKDVELAEREARTLASLDHRKLPRYIEHFEEDGALYLVMEKIEGESLAALRSQKKRTWSPDEIEKMLEDIADALRYLHGRSPFIVHRDIKPGNIIRRPDGSFALVDFGAVRDRLKIGGGSTIVGTFGYMAPEQFQGRASPKSDLYGLGATALAMLTGEEPENLPHEGLGIDVARAVPRGTPAPLVRALTAMLVPDPDRRVDSVDDALAFLHAKGARKKDARPGTADTKNTTPNTDDTKNTPDAARSRRSERKRERHLRREEKRDARDERRRLRAERRSRAAPIIPRLLAQLALLIARLVVWIVVGMVLPLILVILSLIFGGALRRAARACVAAASQAQAAIGKRSAWLSGARSSHFPTPARDVTNETGDHKSDQHQDASEEAQRIEKRARVPSELDLVRAVTPAQAQREAMRVAEVRGVDADAWMEERIAQEEAALLEAQDFEARLRRQSAAAPPPSRADAEPQPLPTRRGQK